MYTGVFNSPAPRQSVGESEWKKMGPMGNVQKESSDVWLRPLKLRRNLEDDRKVIFPRDGRIPYLGHRTAITSEANRAVFPQLKREGNFERSCQHR
jgi:hypothetical protein